LERCVDLPLFVVDVPAGVTAPYGFTRDDFHGLEFGGAAVLLRTGWSRHWETSNYVGRDHPFLTAAGTESLIAGGVGLVGIDALNIDSTVGDDRPAHSGLLAAGIPIVEHLTALESLPATGARFTAVPIKIDGLGTFPVRAFATLPD
jgi:kynurenine formamidase